MSPGQVGRSGEAGDRGLDPVGAENCGRDFRRSVVPGPRIPMRAVTIQCCQRFHLLASTHLCFTRAREYQMASSLAR
jgi:hypothetical protein